MLPFGLFLWKNHSILLYVHVCAVSEITTPSPQYKEKKNMKTWKIVAVTWNIKAPGYLFKPDTGMFSWKQISK